MKITPPAIFFLLGIQLAFSAAAPELDPNLVVLDENGVKNLRIRTMVTEPGTFKETVFALGQIDVYPGKRAIISSRIAGRASAVLIKHDHEVNKGEVAVVVESRQFGDPPPTVELTAPISGLVSKTNVVPGQPISPDESLAEIIDLSEVYALARIPEHLASRLKPGVKANISAPAVAGEVFEAELEHFGATADSENGTIEAAFHVLNPKLLLRPGMRAEFSIVVEERPGVVVVPRSALQGGPADRFVFVKDFDLPHAFLKTAVVVGKMSGPHAEIVSGLLPADEVVIEGAYSLSYVGTGTLSLKEALDAAHGHEHNEDGSEISETSGGSRSKGSSSSAPVGATEHSHDEHDRDYFWMAVSGVLFVALFVLGFIKRPKESSSSIESAKGSN